MSARTVALSRDARVAAAAASVMPKGNAVDALVAGVLAAAAVSPVVLMGHAQAIVAGPGIGIRAVDGRARQPGLGVPRPRGFAPNEEIPDAAWVATPGLPGALAALAASFGTMTLSRLASVASELAPASRRDILLRVGQAGPSALCHPAIAEELIIAAGRLAGGLLTPRDLSEVVPSVVACIPDHGDRVATAQVPWYDASGAPDASVDVLVVADSRGAVAAACFVSIDADIAVDIAPLGIGAPRLAYPVRRGVTRTTPGVILAAPSPIALAATGALHEGSFDYALAVEGRAGLTVLDAALQALRATGELPDEKAEGGSTLLAAMQSGRGVASLLRRLG